MGKEALENLANTGDLKREPPTRAEFDGLVNAARKRLTDARDEKLAPESRFDLTYNAAHGFALAALRQNGYRPDRKRYIVFQTLVHTVGMDAAVMRVFSKAHDQRNLSEYQGEAVVDETFLKELVRHTIDLEKAVLGLNPPPK
jgi:hypothetical protein